MAERQDAFDLSPELLQQHPEIQLIFLVLEGLILALLIGSVVTWFIMIRRMGRREPVLPVEPWTPRVWGLLDLVLILGLIIVGQGISIKLWSVTSRFNLAELRGESDLPLSAMAAVSASYIGVMLVTMAWLTLRYGVSLAHMGFASRKFGSHLRLGLGAALVSLPVVLALMAIVSTTFSEEYDHPMLDRMLEEGSSAAFLLATFCAVISAPITEEFLFRVMLQGWLESIPWSAKNLQWLTGATERERGIETADDAAFPLARILSTSDHSDEVAGDVVNPYTSPASHVAPVNSWSPSIADAQNQVSQLSGATEARPVAGGHAPPFWPVFVSGTLFGLAHLGYGLSFIPLILLGIVLGLLYRATHSIWPCLLVHLILNSFTMVGLGVSLLVKSIAQ